MLNWNQSRKTKNAGKNKGNKNDNDNVDWNSIDKIQKF